MKTDRQRAIPKHRLRAGVVGAGCLVALLGLGSIWGYAGVYGLNVLFRHGGSWWANVATDSGWMSSSMRVALAAAPVAAPGSVTWQVIGDGFEVADLPAMVGGHDVDHVLLARIDPAKFRFEVRTADKGNVGLDQWMARLHPALLIEGSYSGRTGSPATPVVSDGQSLGPSSYDASAGAFVSSPTFTGVRNISHQSWQAAFDGARDAMVSFPLLVVDGRPGPVRSSRWLANRNFVGQDAEGRIIVGTTTDAFFTLERFARFLSDSPIGLNLALNLDGGPVASQGIALNGFERRVYGRWEAQVEGGRAHLLMWPYGSVAMPVVLAVFPR
jgi:hypothetical protein